MIGMVDQQDAIKALPKLARRRIPDPLDSRPSHRALPAWGVSLLFHVIAITAIGWLWAGRPSGTGGAPDRQVGIAVVYETASGDTEYFLSDSGGDQSTSQAAADSVAAAAASADSGALESLLSDILPGESTVGGELESASGGLGLGDGGTQLSGGRDIPKARTTVFGIEGEGTRFLYVFDRSDSMNGYGGAPLAAAKRELINSLNSLGPQHQFQIVFYNETPLPFGGMGPRGPQLFKGDESSKQAAMAFVRDVSAIGGTRHLSAIQMGLAMGPDCLFFLTDADQPAPGQRDTEDLVVRASRSGTTIHAIQFGAGPQQGSSWIRDLATRTGGQYRYVDVTQLP
ncbi:MAG: hypothetical protein D6753_14430 [Planctomycetota bacterium]|nr:MAG: hypothetical protein D6753_14430 [Planctomycetota bacterium]